MGLGGRVEVDMVEWGGWLVAKEECKEVGMEREERAGALLL